MAARHLGGFEVNNIFNERPKVRDARGDMPFGYQPDLLDPIGRTVAISFRKLFLPRRFFGQGGGQRGGDATRPWLRASQAIDRSHR